MSDRRHAQRPALPEDYQFGDAAYTDEQRRLYPLAVHARAYMKSSLPFGWRAPHENAAEQLKRREMVDGATLAPGDRPFITIRPECQRTGDETV